MHVPEPDEIIPWAQLVLGHAIACVAYTDGMPLKIYLHVLFTLFSFWFPGTYASPEAASHSHMVHSCSGEGILLVLNFSNQVSLILLFVLS